MSDRSIADGCGRNRRRRRCLHRWAELKLNARVKKKSKVGACVFYLSALELVLHGMSEVPCTGGTLRGKEIAVLHYVARYESQLAKIGSKDTC